MTDQDPPVWSSLWLRLWIAWYESIARPSLSGLAIISAATAVVGYASSYDNPDLAIYLRCAALGLGLWLIARTFWAGAWLLPALETKRPLLVFAFFGAIGFGCFAVPSGLGSLFANGGGVSVSVSQQENVDRIDNARQEFAFYIEALPLVQVGLEDRADQARGFQADEIAGRGPTGIPGVGSVSNSFGASARSYDQAAAILGEAVSRAQTHIDALDSAMAELRAAQVDPDLPGAAKEAQLKLLSGKAIGEMRALLALDPARAIRTAAAKIATGVPRRSDARATSQARIADISGRMRAHAQELTAEADRLEAEAPDLPQQVTLSPAERILETMWRMPGLTMAALLFDLCGWIAVLFRQVLYMALKAKLEEEAREPTPPFVTLGDLERVKSYYRLLREARDAIDETKEPSKRGRPKGSTKAVPPKKPKTGKPSDDGERTDE